MTELSFTDLERDVAYRSLDGVDWKDSSIGPAFYRAHKDEINRIVGDVSIGHESPEDLFGTAWDKSDPFAFEDANQTIMAQFGYLSVQRKLRVKLAD